MTTKLLVFSTRADGLSKLSQVEKDLGYPRESFSLGPGIRPRPEEVRSLRYSEIEESNDSTQFAIPVEKMLEQRLSDAEKARVVEVDLKAWAKPLTASEVLIEEEAVKP
jgi:hypothetical protein